MDNAIADTIHGRIGSSNEEKKIIDHPLVGVGVVIVRNNTILLGKRKGCASQSGTFACPGGKTEVGETLEQTCYREVKEETGLDITNLKKLKMYEDITTDEHCICFLFSARLKDEKQEPMNTEPEKNESWIWTPVDQLPHPLFRSLKNLTEMAKWPEILYE